MKMTRWKNVVSMLRGDGFIEVPAVSYSRSVFVYTSQDDTDNDFAVSMDDIARDMPEPVWLYRLNESPDDEIRPRWALILLMQADGEAQAREGIEKACGVLAYELRNGWQANDTNEDA